jgi:hypothetical protein
MSSAVATNKRQPSLLDRLNIVQSILTILMAVGGVVAGVWWTQGNTVMRLTSAEKQIEENKAEQAKQIEDINSRMTPRTEILLLLREMTATREDVKATRAEVNEIRAEQLRQARAKQ